MGTHTSTGEWQSFEVRMRYRRAERLLLRAEAAAEAGFIDEARAAVEEARSLAPRAEGIAETHARVEAEAFRRAVAATKRGGPATRAIVAATVGVLVVASAAAGTWLARVQRAPALVRGSDTVLPAPPSPALRIETDAVSGGQISIVQSNLDGRSPSPVATSGPEEATAAVTRTAAEVPPTVEPLHPPTPAAPPAVVSQVSVLQPNLENRELTPAVDAAPPMTGSLAVAPPPSPTRLTANDASPARPIVNDASLVRTVLDRFASAYSTLDVEAASAAWPKVNRAALSRAFDGLESQQVTFGACDVNVEGTTARAACRGTATWRPKIGGGRHTDARLWTFDLAKADAGWHIVDARVQNR